MKSAVALPITPSLAQTRVADYAQLVRPRLALLVLATTAASWRLAAREDAALLPLMCAMVGTALLFAGASALNQLLERNTDALMQRTANRPLPAGRIQTGSVLILGCGLSALGLAVLLAIGQPLAAGLGAFALVAYVLVYTPLKTVTTLNTLIGAIPGAVPALIGWAAARGRLDAGALAMFLMVFLWQIPHFLAIAWMYRDEYAAAGLHMLPVFDPSGVETGRQMVRYTLILTLAGLLPSLIGVCSWLMGLGALVLGAMFVERTVRFARHCTTSAARQVFHGSLVYLSALLVLFVLDTTLWSGR